MKRDDKKMTYTLNNILENWSIENLDVSTLRSRLDKLLSIISLTTANLKRGTRYNFNEDQKKAIEELLDVSDKIISSANFGEGKCTEDLAAIYYHNIKVLFSNLKEEDLKKAGLAALNDFERKYVHHHISEAYQEVINTSLEDEEIQAKLNEAYQEYVNKYRAILAEARNRNPKFPKERSVTIPNATITYMSASNVPNLLDIYDELIIQKNNIVDQQAMDRAKRKEDFKSKAQTKYCEMGGEKNDFLKYWAEVDGDVRKIIIFVAEIRERA